MGQGMFYLKDGTLMLCGDLVEFTQPKDGIEKDSVGRIVRIRPGMVTVKVNEREMEISTDGAGFEYWCRPLWSRMARWQQQQGGSK